MFYDQEWVHNTMSRFAVCGETIITRPSTGTTSSSQLPATTSWRHTVRPAMKTLTSSWDIRWWTTNPQSAKSPWSCRGQSLSWPKALSVLMGKCKWFWWSNSICLCWLLMSLLSVFTLLFDGIGLGVINANIISLTDVYCIRWLDLIWLNFTSISVESHFHLAALKFSSRRWRLIFQSRLFWG